MNNFSDYRESLIYIPKKWNICRFKDVYQPKKEIVGSNVSKYERLALTLKGVIKRSKDDDKGLQPSDFESYQIINRKDMVFKMIDLQNISTSRVGLTPWDGLVSPAYLRFSPKYEDPGFMYFYFMSLYYLNVFNNIAGDGVRSALNSTDIGNIICPFPTIIEQQKIVNILNKKVSQINALILNQENQIEKLKEYKQSLITKIVTKGLNKNVEMKDSGLAFLDAIPCDWQIQKILFQLSMPVTDGPHTTPVLQNEGIAFVSAEAVSCGNGIIDFSHIRGFVSEEFYEECCKKYIPEIDDIYMIKSGATTGKVSIVTTVEPKFTIWSPIAVMRVNKKKMISKFLYYAVQTDFFQKQIELGWSYGTQQNLSMRTLEQLKVVVPPIIEQEKIIAYLDKKCNAFNRLIEIKHSKIEKLQEYKKSIIYEYVTGKKLVD